MGLGSILGIRGVRDKPKNSYGGSEGYLQVEGEKKSRQAMIFSLSPKYESWLLN